MTIATADSSLQISAELGSGDEAVTAKTVSAALAKALLSPPAAGDSRCAIYDLKRDAVVRALKSGDGILTGAFVEKKVIPAIVASAGLRGGGGDCAFFFAAPNDLPGGVFAASETVISRAAAAAFGGTPLFSAIAILFPPGWWAALFEVLYHSAVCLGVVSAAAAVEEADAFVSLFLTPALENLKKHACATISEENAVESVVSGQFFGTEVEEWGWMFADTARRFPADAKIDSAISALSRDPRFSHASIAVAAISLTHVWLTAEDVVEIVFGCVVGGAMPAEISRRFPPLPEPKGRVGVCVQRDFVDSVSRLPLELEASIVIGAPPSTATDIAKFVGEIKRAAGGAFRCLTPCEFFGIVLAKDSGVSSFDVAERIFIRTGPRVRRRGKETLAPFAPPGEVFAIRACTNALRAIQFRGIVSSAARAVFGITDLFEAVRIAGWGKAAAVSLLNRAERWSVRDVDPDDEMCESLLSQTRDLEARVAEARNALAEPLF